MKIFFSAFALLTLFGSPNTQASAPPIKKQAPGFYRMMVGDTEVTVLLDGAFPLKVGDMLQNIKPAQVNKLLEQAYEGPAVTTSVNGFLINTGSKLVLVDSGAGSLMGASVGHLLENLKASGYQPEQVDEVYLTHLHGDHFGGLATEGKRNFPQAVVRADRHEIEYWLNPKEAARAADEQHKSTFANAALALGPYQKEGKLKPFDGETELVPGVFAHPAYGHTPGHSVYTVESKQKKLWLYGDMIHVAAVQFPVPTATMKFDWDSKLAAPERIKHFEQAAKAGDWIGAAHLAYPGMGHIRKAGSGFVFTPVAYAPVAP